MAESIQKAVDDILECPICIEKMDDTRVLPCIHTFCLKCISQHGNDNKRDGTFSCPCCRQTCSVPLGGYEELPKNILLEKLLEIRDSMVEESTLDALQMNGDNGGIANSLPEQGKVTAMCSPVQCQTGRDNSYAITNDEGSSRLCQMPCHSGDGTRPPLANGYCVECESYVCSECWKRHSQERATISHLVLPTGCPEHPEKSLEFYCQYCKVAICVTCSSSMHRRHMCSSLTDHKNSLEREIATMQSKISLTETLKREIESLKAKTVHAEKLERQIKSLRSKLTDVETLESENKQLKSRIASLEKSDRAHEQFHAIQKEIEIERLKSREAQREAEILKLMLFHRQLSDGLRIEIALSHLPFANECWIPRELTDCTGHPSEHPKLICGLCGKRLCLRCLNRKFVAAQKQTDETFHRICVAGQTQTDETDTSCLRVIVVILIGIIVCLMYCR